MSEKAMYPDEAQLFATLAYSDEAFHGIRRMRQAMDIVLPQYAIFTVHNSPYPIIGPQAPPELYRHWAGMELPVRAAGSGRVPILACDAIDLLHKNGKERVADWYEAHFAAHLGFYLPDEKVKGYSINTGILYFHPQSGEMTLLQENQGL